MPAVDHPSVGAMTPGTVGKRGVVVASSLHNYKIAHQKVSIEVDLESNRISGYTELIVIPTDPLLKVVKLDCRQMEITNVLVNQRRAKYIHDDSLKKEFDIFTSETNEKPIYTDINQHHLYKNTFKKIYSGENTEELAILMPDKLKLSLHDPSAVNFTPSFKDSPGSHKASIATDMIYTPVTIKIEYNLKNSTSGVHFVGGKGSKISKSEWHAYTTNSSYGISTSSWVPCVDSLWERSTWELEISVPQTIKDIGVSKIIGSKFIDNQNEEETEDSLDIVVISGESTNQKESAHPIDSAKKLVTFSIFNPTSAHHIGWAVGPFTQTPLINLKEEEEAEDGDQEKDTTAVPSFIYSLGSREADALNTTIFIYKAIDFYSREFGSFPYTSNALVFVSESDVSYSGFAGLSVMSDKLLYRPNVIEPIYESTYTLSVALSDQWSGINVTPRSYNDLWVTVGISHFMAQQFVRNLMGLNEYKYRIKKQADKICNEDVGKRPLADPVFKFPISVHDLDFLRLKAPIVLFILDRRMTKTDKSFGLSRVIPKIFLQAMSGDLPNGCLSTHHFQHVCEKVNHNRLDSFFRQWVYGAGVPIFRVTQRFNKKRMFIEMGIRQVQEKEGQQQLHPSSETFISDARSELEKDEEQVPPTLFTGPMTIRIHEADGTPYEHIVDLKEGFTKLDIQYNTKYKRLKRSQKQIRSEREQRDAAAKDDEEEVLLHCLGDILQTEQEIEKWELTEWTKEEEERMTNEAFEWIRVDADFEWICKIYINQPDYMYASQLQQDRDVEAQLQSILYFANSNASALYSSILLRTLMDSRYYFGIRIEAAYGLAKFAKEQTNWIGSKHLLMAFKNLFCLGNSAIPRPNDFSDFSSYFIQKAIPQALSTVKDQTSNSPLEIKKFLLNILRYNQNISNSYSDTYYVCHLIECLINSIVANPLIKDSKSLNDKDRSFLEDAVSEISRHQKMDELVDSEGFISLTVLTEKLRLSRAGLYEFDIDDLLKYTVSSSLNRVPAFEALFSLGALKNDEILHYFFSTVLFEKSLHLKHELIKSFSRSIGFAVVEGASFELDEDELTKEISLESYSKPSDDNGFIVVEDGVKEEFESRRDAAARASLKGAIELLRRDYSGFEPLRRELWNTVRHPLLGIPEKRDLFELISVIIPAVNTLPVTFEIPREKKVAAENAGNGKVVLKREGQFKISIVKKAPVLKPKLKIVEPLPKVVKYKPDIRRSKTGPLRYVKISRSKKIIVVSSDTLRRSPKKVTKEPVNTRPVLILKPSSKSQTEPPAEVKKILTKPKPEPTPTEPTKPKLKLKFKF